MSCSVHSDGSPQCVQESTHRCLWIIPFNHLEKLSGGQMRIIPEGEEAEKEDEHKILNGNDLLEPRTCGEEAIHRSLKNFKEFTEEIKELQWPWQESFLSLETLKMFHGTETSNL